ncbi:MAG: YciI family protein [Cyclobacteriaceae bacterium]
MEIVIITSSKSNSMNARLFLFLIFGLLFSSAKAQDSTPQYVTYYFVELIPSEESKHTEDEAKAIQLEHMINIGKMVKSGQLLLAGPFPEGGGLFILKMKSKEAAEDLVKTDPAVMAGRFNYRIKTWVTEKGLLTLEK